ncbi:MAG TPA: hypothetical protein VN087_05300 [Verrucomicrobiae bacterium]|nr:hypothetical protein [Verrucomicrobiae bacterium]
MDWAPVSKERFDEILSREISSLAPGVQRLYEQYAVQPFHLPCLRDQGAVREQVFVVAKKGNRLLYFDEVEEDFGITIPDEGGVMREWGNYGPLVRALLVLDED